MPRAPKKTLAERLWPNLNRVESGCWLWTGSKYHNGYGRIAQRELVPGGPRKRVYVRAHRAAWMLANGPIPPGLLVCHRCDVRLCCNPEHLFLGTYAEEQRGHVGEGPRTPLGRTGRHDGPDEVGVRRPPEDGDPYMKQERTMSAAEPVNYTPSLRLTGLAHLLESDLSPADRAMAREAHLRELQSWLADLELQRELTRLLDLGLIAPNAAGYELTGAGLAVVNGEVS